MLHCTTPDAALYCMENTGLDAIWITDDSLLEDLQYEKTTEEIREYVRSGGSLVLCGVRSSSGDITNTPTHPRRWLMEVLEMFWRYPADDAPVDAVIIRFAWGTRSLLLWSKVAPMAKKVADERGSKGSRLPRRILELLPTNVVLPRDPPVVLEREEPHGPVEARMEMRLMPPELYGNCQACSGWIYNRNDNSALVRPDSGDTNQDAQAIVSTFILDEMSQLLMYDWDRFAETLRQKGKMDEIVDLSKEEWRQHVDDLIAKRRTHDVHEEETSDNQHEEETSDNQLDEETSDNQHKEETSDDQHKEETSDNQLDEETSDDQNEEGTSGNQDEEETSNDNHEEEISDNQHEEETSDDQLDEETNNNQHEKTSDDQHEEETSDNQDEEEASNDSIEEMNDSIEEMNDSMEEMNDSMEEMNDSMEEMNDSMEEMNDSMEETNDDEGAIRWFPQEEDIAEDS